MRITVQGQKDARFEFSPEQTERLLAALAEAPREHHDDAVYVAERLRDAQARGSEIVIASRSDRRRFYAAFHLTPGLTEEPYEPFCYELILAVHSRDMEKVHRAGRLGDEREVASERWGTYGRFIQPRRVRAYRHRLPRIALTGLGTTSLDALLGGRLLAATTAWWNEFLGKRPLLVKYELLVPLSENDRERLQASINRRNDPFLATVAVHRSPLLPALSVACLALSYAFARTMEAGTADDEVRAATFAKAGEITPELWEDNNKRFSIVAEYYYDDGPSPGWWREREESWVPHALAVPAIRWAYRDQAKRWERAEGQALGEGAGFAPLGEEGGLLVDFKERLFEEGGRLLDCERFARNPSQP